MDELIKCVKHEALSKSIKMSIIYSNTNNIYPIRDCPSWDFHCYANEDNIYKDCNVPSHIKQEYERQQIFIRYISHTQNIAARLIFAKLAKDNKKQRVHTNKKAKEQLFFGMTETLWRCMALINKTGYNHYVKC